MIDSEHSPQLDACGCCETDMPTPEHSNRPALPALAYRIGAHAAFLRRMLARLSGQALNNGARPLARLTTRAADDPAIALLDAWAVVADVLTFYQERIANEGYLRTATERRSVLELARAIGYELSPGVAASAFLAFTVEDAPGSPGVAVVPKGTQVQSIPAQGKLPQTFETSDEITARAEWNVLKPRLTQPQPLDPNARRVFLKGVTTNLQPGDLLLLAARDERELTTRIRRIRRIAIETEFNRTRVELDAITYTDPKRPPQNTPSGKPGRKPGRKPLRFDQDAIAQQVLQQTWREGDLDAFLKLNRWSAGDLQKHIGASSKSKAKSLSADEGVFAFRARAGFFGHNAPRWNTLPAATRFGEFVKLKDLPDLFAGGAFQKNWDAAGRDIWADSQEDSYTEADAFLERSVPEVLPDSWVVFDANTGANPLRRAYRVRATVERSLADYGLNAKVTGLLLAEPDGSTPPEKPAEFNVRRTTAYVRSEPLELSETPIEEPLADDDRKQPRGATQVTLDRLTPGLQIGQALMLGGEQVDALGVIRHEVVVLDDIVHSDGYTTLHFRERLQHRYSLHTVTLNANIARATHGETVAEVLGSGEATQAHQRFTLKKPPLTFISAPTASGAASTLVVRVNDIERQPAPALYGLTPRDESYTVQIDDDGTASVIFGDGQSGARLPAGQENVAARYRSGIGPEGEVSAGSLILMPTRPLGIRHVTNALPATGAAAPEKLDDARQNAPRKVLTLDRVVSLQDFEDFAAAFAAIGKAQAARAWNGEMQIVHITVASANGDPIDPQDERLTHLRRALDAARDPVQPVRVESFQPLFFNLSARVLTDSRFEAAKVLAEIENALRTAFSFQQRTFGQAVTSAEVLTVIQKVPGVVATDLDALYLVTDPPELAAVLQAATARWDAPSGEIQPAQLLLIHPAGVTLTELPA
ncbi:MAG TPA: putative baseplate assembly protein [Anaerolineae bacterium]|nr:putative baseplate assembly protein [Anaerolineae bacterium]